MFNHAFLYRLVTIWIPKNIHQDKISTRGQRQAHIPQILAQHCADQFCVLEVRPFRSTKPSVGSFSVRANSSELESLFTSPKSYANTILSAQYKEREHHLFSDIWGHQLKQGSDQIFTRSINYPSNVLYLLWGRCEHNHLIFFQTVLKKLVQLAQTQRFQGIKCWIVNPPLITGLSVPALSQARTDSLSDVAW